MLAALLAVPLAVGLLVGPPSPPGAPTVRAVEPLTPLRVVRSFDATVTRYGPGHRGVDLAGAPGDLVVAALAGRIAFAGPVAGVPVVSEVLPGGRRLTYEPVRTAVRAGQQVARGALIGRLDAGHPGCRAAACLHWGLIRTDGSYADPLALLSGGAVRLLPLDPPGRHWLTAVSVPSWSAGRAASSRPATATSPTRRRTVVTTASAATVSAAAAAAAAAAGWRRRRPQGGP